MSTVKLEIGVNVENALLIGEFLASLAGGGAVKKAEVVKVVDAEEVEIPSKTPPKAPTPRPSRAKPKPVSYDVKETEDEDEDFSDDEEIEDGVLGKEEEEIDADDIRALQAEKVDKHRATIKAQLGKLGATGIKDLDPKNYQKYYDFLAKLK